VTQQGEPEETGRPTVRDKRRIDPETYQLCDPADEQPRAEGADTSTPAQAAASDQNVTASPEEQTEATAEVDQLKSQLADRTADLQRVQAEYVNYKRRVDRDRDLSRKAGIEQVLRDLLNVFDGLQTAREHDELTGGFKALAEEVEKVAAKHGLESFGEAGDPFDPRIHEALMHAQADGLTGPTCVTILQPGYRIGDRIIRAARVAVAEPEESAGSSADDAAGQPEDDGAAESQQ